MQERRPKTRGDLSPREGVWFAKPRPLRRTQRSIPGFWKPFVYGPLLFGFVGFRVPEWGYWIAAIGLLFLLALAFVWQVVETLALRARPSDRALSDALPGITEYWAEVVLFDSRGAFGADRGIVWFEDGLLTFNGAACSFVLSAEDLYPRWRRSEREFYRALPGGALRLRVPKQKIYLKLSPLSGRGCLGFDYRLGRFLASVPTGSRSRQWPPLVPYEIARTIEEAAPRAKDRRVDALQ